MNKIYYLLLGLLACAGLWSCDDDFGREYGIPDGESLLTMRLDFRDFTPALESRGTAGDAIETIENLTVAVYKTDGTNVLTQRITDYTVKPGLTDKDRPDTIPAAETSTGHAEFKLRLHNDRYRIYAVANYDVIGNLGDKPTEEELKNIKLDWNNDVKKNNAMFGFFATDDAANPPTTFNAPEVAVRGSGTLHAWIRRAVSKLTIVYDGSGLKNGVAVYIKSAQIKDMPYDCLLGAPNDYNRIKGDYVLVDGDTLKYYPGDKEPSDDWANFDETYVNRVTRGGPRVGSHSEKANSLFFYENIQENGQVGTITDKRQDVTGENKQVSYPGGKYESNPAWKDGRRYGTYVEIKGFYTSIADGHMSQGPITYRFMLGKNTIDNYEAERNYHYKLTMTFKGYANDVDFHIDYKVIMPSAVLPPYRISYLYNHSMYYPISVSSGNKKVTKVQADIIENHWWPTGAEAAENNQGGIYNPVGVAAPDDYQWHGFLSLRKTRLSAIIPPAGGIWGSNATTNDASQLTDQGVNARYYFDHLRHSREYSDMTPGWHQLDKRSSAPRTTTKPNGYTEDPDDLYFVKVNDADPDSLVYELQVPMYTRARNMIKSTAYTGNNVYKAYQRGAKVRFKIWLEGDPESKPTIQRDVPITQVRRIENPKGIYRTENDNSDFYVELKYLKTEEATEFTPLTSEGKWRASVLGDQIVTLSRYEGDHGDKINFTVKFTGASGAAVILVEYHQYSCQHLIFIRKGSEPMQLRPGGAKWHFSNLRTKDAECKLPQEEGSFFKWGRLDMPLDASTNRNDQAEWINVEYSSFKPSANKLLNIATTDYKTPTVTKKWGDFYAIGIKEAFGTTSKGHKGTLGVSGRIASFEDFEELRLDDNIAYGFGVLYGDGATTTATNIADAYGYVWNNSEEARKKQGVRGIFIYNQDAKDPAHYAKNIFLPVGNSGYGRRRHAGVYQWGDPNATTDEKSAGKFRHANYAGVLKYAARNGFYGNNLNQRPLFYDLWRRPGAIYWIDKPTSAGVQGWDINYFTFDFFPFNANDLMNTASLGKEDGYDKYDTSACFIRLVSD